MADTRHVVGCMTGTSLDAIDVALARIDGHGLEMTASFVGIESIELGDSLRTMLLRLAQGEPARPLEISRAARQLGERHRDAVQQLIERCLPDGASLDLVVAHGQTICHVPGERLSWQLFDPWPIVSGLGVPVCYDLRQADLAAGGQGAPITPLADWVLFRSAQANRLIVNLGGICNVTRIDKCAEPKDVTGGDIGPCNLLLDGLAAKLFPPARMDLDGRLARQGQVLTHVLESWDQRLDLAGDPAARSMGREDFSGRTLSMMVDDAGHAAEPHDVVATAVEWVAQLVARAGEKAQADELILAGGGARHPLLVERITALASPARVIDTDALGLPVESREAVAFAVLAALSQDGVVVTLPAVTGAKSPGLAGAWAYPGG